MKINPESFWIGPLCLALCGIGYAQSTDRSSARSTKPAIPQGLYRLAGMPATSGGATIPASAISIVDITSPQTAGPLGRVISQGRVQYLALAPGKEWSTKLRPLKDGANYTTFTIQASLDTVISVDGALVTLVKSTIPGYATVMAGYYKGDAVEWVSLLHDVELRPYGGQLMGTLAIVTICTDTENRRWSVSLCDRLVVHDLPLGTADLSVPRMFTVKPGSAGASICGIASCDENPVFEDANDNGIRDSFEEKLLGAPLKRDASRETTEALVHAWKERKYMKPSDYALAAQEGTIDWDLMPAEYNLELPAFDRTTQTDGATVHGVPTSAIYK